MSRELLELDRVSFGRSGFSLEDVSLSLGAGEILAVLGPNGAGKSTLLALAAGLLAPDAGEVGLLGQPVGRLSRRELARILGYLPQSPDLPAGMTVAEVASLGRFARLRGLGFLSPADVQAVRRVLDAAGLMGLADRRADRLSGGERQRLLLASVLAQEPRLLVLDEPERGLDLGHQIRLFELFRDCASRGLGVLLATHDLNLAAAYAHRALLLREGKVVRLAGMDRSMDQELRDQVYGRSVSLTRHPDTGRPAVLPYSGGKP